MAKSFYSLVASGLFIALQALPLRAANDSSIVLSKNASDQIVGAVGCQSSMCHGGASPSRNQFTIWSHKDAHSRAYATLVTAYSKQMAAGLGLPSAAGSTRCTICHAPFAAFSQGDLMPSPHALEGVSCESCHNPAGTWLRSHTRPDLTYTDRVESGLRDLRSPYVRANTCVVCHQVIDSAILKAGHPELIFELDGLTASEPRHWQEKAEWPGAKAWLVGQAIALREIDSMLTYSSTGDSLAEAQGDAIAWVLRNVPGVNASGIGTDYLQIGATRSNQLARSISDLTWTPEMTNQALASLAGTSSSFINEGISVQQREARAERLVLGLDRLFKSIHPEPSAPRHAELSALFAAIQDRDQFNPEKFASLLQKFAEVVASKK